jgi:hypothetical protein
MKLNRIVEYIFKERKFRLIRENHIRCHSIFANDSKLVMTENDNNHLDALNAIKNNDWEDQDAKRFKEALNKSKHKEMLSEYSISELSSMKLFKLNGYNIGYALKKKRW